VSLEPTARRTGAAVAALAALSLSAGCSLLPLAGQAAGQTSGAPSTATSDPSTAAGTAGGRVARVGTSVEQQDLGSLTQVDDGTTVVTLTGVRRISTDLGLVTITMHAPDGPASLPGDWNDQSLSHSPYEVAEVSKRYDLSGVTVTTAGDPTVYQTAVTADDECLCTRLPGTLESGATFAAYAYVTLPPAATTVDVVVGSLGPWKDVPLS